jgi:acyl carrier protein
MAEVSNGITFEEAKEKVVCIVKEYANVSDTDPELTIDDDFTDFAINSVDFIKIIVGIETAFDFEFYDDDLQMGRFNNMRDLIDYIVQRKAA